MLPSGLRSMCTKALERRLSRPEVKFTEVVASDFSVGSSLL